MSYAELVGDRKLTLKVNPAAPLKDPKDYTIVGKPVPRLDIPAKIFGTFDFVQDVKVPGMLHARVVHPAGVRSTLQSFDDSRLPQDQRLRARRAQGRLPRGGGDQRMGGHQRLDCDRRQVVGLGGPARRSRSSSSTCATRRSTATKCSRARGNTAEALKAGGRTLQATYDLAMNTHGSIGPSCAVAEFKNGHLTVWTPSQASHLLRLQLATMLQMKPENVRCIYVEGAGCYGRNGSDDCSSEAALISKEIGRPVRLQWMRQDEHGWDPKGPPILLDYRASIDDQGRIAAWESDIFMPERPMRRSGVTLLAAVLANLPKFGPPSAPLAQHRARHSLLRSRTTS